MLLKKYPSRRAIGIPVSICEKNNEFMSNLTSGVLLRYKYNVKKSFDENAQQIHKAITKELNGDREFALRFIAQLPMTLIDAVLLNTHNLCTDRLAKMTAKVMGYSGKKVKDMGISNLTVLDIPTSYYDYEIENIIFVPPAVSYSHNIIGVSTVNGKMTISYHNMV